MKECLNYKVFSPGVLECRACHHFCKIREGRTGICGGRQNIGNKLFLLTYGIASALNVDPMEKKPLFHFLPGTKTYSFGTIGCNFRCLNCQNYDISQASAAVYLRNTAEYGSVDWGREMLPAEIVADALRHGCRSVSCTYNEPTIFLEYALDTMKLAREKGLKNVWVSNGFMSDETLDLVIPYLDAANIDIKSFAPDFYEKICGASLAPVLKNCQRLSKEKVWLEITTLVIPGYSDNEEMFFKLASFIKNELGTHVPWHVTAFSGAISWKMKEVSDTAPEEIAMAAAIGKKAGLKYVYPGNVASEASTNCPACGAEIIRRRGYNIQLGEKNGKCDACGEKIEGVFV